MSSEARSIRPSLRSGLRPVPERPDLRARKVPRQSRSQMTVTALIEATRMVLLSRGYAECTTNLVAEVAGVGIGSLYEYFPNKDALVAALVEREVDAYVAALESDMDASYHRPFEEATALWLDRALEGLESRADLLRILLVEYPYATQLPSVLRLPRRVAELCARCLTRWGTEVEIADHPATYQVLANMLGGAYLCQVLRPTPAVTREAMLATTGEVLLRILRPSHARVNHQNQRLVSPTLTMR